jgi:hypothetical protein
MIHEFAVDPEAIASWQNFRYVVENFGVSQGRLISRFPKEWRKLVLKACENCRDVEKKRITVALERIDAKLFNAGRNYDKNVDWIPNAVASHREKPFRAIITTAEQAASTEHLDVDSLSDEVEPWSVPRGAAVPRTAADMATAAEKLLRCSAEIVFVDPHFGGESRFGKPLAAMIRCACEGRVPRRFEYHLTAKSIPGQEFSRQLERQQSHLRIPPGVKLVFVRWNQLDEGDTLHPRYILTEKGGLRFEHGLDEGNPGETTDVECLASANHAERRAQYHPGAGAFQLVDAWMVTSEAVIKVTWDGNEFVRESAGGR